MENIKKSRPPLRRSGLFNFGLIASSGQTVGDGILGVAVNEGGELVGGSDPAIVRPRVVQGFTSGVAPGATVAVVVEVREVQIERKFNVCNRFVNNVERS